MVYWRPVPYSWNFGMFLMIDIYIYLRSFLDMEFGMFSCWFIGQNTNRNWLIIYIYIEKGYIKISYCSVRDQKKGLMCILYLYIM